MAKLKDTTIDGTLDILSGGGVNNLFGIIHPIGDIIMSINTEYDPNNIFIGQTWERYAKGRTIFGVDEDNTNFNTVEKTGGKEERKLTAAIGAVTNDSSSIGYIAGDASSFQKGRNASYAICGTVRSTPYYWNHGTPVTEHDVNSEETSFLPPYVTCYVWVRVA